MFNMSIIQLDNTIKFILRLKGKDNFNIVSKASFPEIPKQP